MKAVRAREAGGPEVLEYVDVPEPAPGPGQIRVRNEAVGLNFIDTYQRSGLYPMPYPLVLGLEGAGVVDAVGEGVTRFKVGDRAAYSSGGPGAYAEAYIAAEGRVSKLPDGIDARTAAGAMLKGMTAEYLLRRCFPLQRGQTCLVWAASGGTGSILTQWAHALGATVIGVVGTEDKAAKARAQGCDHVLNHRTDDVAARVREITGGEGVHVSYDGVGKASFEASLKSLRKRGMLVCFGNASGPVPPVDPLVLSRGGSLFLTRPTLFDYVATTAELDESAAALFEVIASGAVKIEIGQEFPLSETRAAHEALEAGATSGSTLLIP